MLGPCYHALMLQSTFPHDEFKAWQVAVREGTWMIREGDEVGEITGPLISRPIPISESEPVEVGDDGSLTVHQTRFPSGSWFMAWAAVFVPNHAELERTLIVPGREVEPPVRMMVTRKCITPLGVCDFETTWARWEQQNDTEAPEMQPFEAPVATATPKKPTLL